MYDVLYLHGFGDTAPEDGPIARALKQAARPAEVHIPHYHPNGQITGTNIGETLRECEDIIEALPTAKVHLVGYSFGGLLAAILAWKRDDLVENVLLLAPAIDNFDRNYADRDPDTWQMPPEYVAELQTFPARPKVVRPTTLVHGMLDVDREGSAPWRVEQWATEQSFDRVYLLDEVDHSLEPWMSADNRTQSSGEQVPTFRDLVRTLLALD